MTEILKIDLENEMDLILTHKKSMKLAELCGLSVLTQTSFATAVSEISRCVIGGENSKSTLHLCIYSLSNNKKELVARLDSTMEFGKQTDDSIKYATRLVGPLKITRQKNKTQIDIIQKINFGGLLNDAKVEAFISYFKKELPLSPYDEIRKRNIQLLELSEKLRDSEEQYKRLTETLPLMIFTTNAAGNLIYGNNWLKNYFGFTEIVSGKLSWLSLAESSEYKNLSPAWEKAQTKRTPLNIQAKLKFVEKNESIWHLISLIPLENEANQLVGWTGFFVDIHAQKLVEETLKNNVELKTTQKQLLASQAKLEENIRALNKSNHDLEQFAYIASHDLQEPLRKIRNFTELLGENIKEEKTAKKYLTKIDVASSRMATLIRDVLNYSRLSKGGSNFENIDLNIILAGVKSDVELIIEEKNAIVKSTSLPVINGLGLQLHQLFYNLINNALKFSTSQPVIKISSRQLTDEEVQQHEELHKSAKYIELVIADNGIGFDQKHAKQVFTIFKRLHSKESFEGTGIGLALCKKIVDNHHGIISAESEIGKGATFKITLPAD
jgi:PAS domain S-box-containing protein